MLAVGAVATANQVGTALRYAMPIGVGLTVINNVSRTAGGVELANYVIAGILAVGGIVFSIRGDLEDELRTIVGSRTAVGSPDPNDPCKGRTRPTLPDKNIVSQGGVKVEHYYRSNDHAPAHMHVTVNGKTVTRIGPNGKPIPGDPSLPTSVQRVIDDNLRTIRNAGDRLGRALNYDEDCGEK